MMDGLKQRDEFETAFLKVNKDVSGVISGDDLLYCNTEGVYQIQKTQRLWEAWKRQDSKLNP